MKHIVFAAVIPVVGMLAACGTKTRQGATGVTQPTEAGPMEPTELQVVNDPSRRWGELQIAVNPKNPNNIAYADVGLNYTYACQNAHDPNCDVVQAHISGVGSFAIPQAQGFFTKSDFSIVSVFASSDQGKTWQRSNLPAYPAGFPALRIQGDPSLTAGPDGTFYASWDALNWGTTQNALPSAGVAVSKSTDGGRTWSDPVLSGTPVDGPKITADLITGTVYEASSGGLGPKSTGDPNASQGQVTTRWLVSSTDGVHWTTPQPMGGQGSYMSAAYGMLATAFSTSAQASLFSQANNDLCDSAPAPCTIFQTTTDSGVTWSRHAMAVPSPSNSFPGAIIAADPSKQGRFAVGLLAQSEGEFHVYQTSDAGSTWTGPAIVTEDATKPHFHGYLAYSRQGVLGLIWRSWQGAPPGQAVQAGPFAGSTSTYYPYNTWAAMSRDGGGTFSQPLKISRADSPAPQSGQFGNAGDDFSGLALEGEYVYAGWADWRPGERSGYFSAARLDAFKPSSH